MSSLADVARRIPGVSTIEGVLNGALTSVDDLAIPDYDNQSADQITAALNDLSQLDLRKVDAYERKHKGRTTITDKVTRLTSEQPWPGYDELSADAAVAAVAEHDKSTAKTVRDYERSHKDRSSVIEATGLRLDSD